VLHTREVAGRSQPRSNEERAFVMFKVVTWNVENLRGTEP